MQYVARWRAQLAAHLLRDERATVGELAGRLGYRSEAAFARAFKREIGVSPGSVGRSTAQSGSGVQPFPEGWLAPLMHRRADCGCQ
jgi:AraC-like DNA-binding protein